MTDGDAADALVEMAAAFTELARAMSEDQADGFSPSRVLQFAACGVPGAEHAGVSIARGSARPEALAATGELPLQMERLQHETGEGPALEALQQSDVVVVPDLAGAEHWQAFAGRAVAGTPVRSILSFRLFLTSQDRGALTFYSTERDAYPNSAIAIGAVFAAYMSLTLLNWLHEDKVMHLERALESNREIGVALGILMARQLCTRDEAFASLRSASQHLHLHRKLHDIAAEVQITGQLPTVP